MGVCKATGGGKAGEPSDCTLVQALVSSALLSSKKRHRNGIEVFCAMACGLGREGMVSESSSIAAPANKMIRGFRGLLDRALARAPASDRDIVAGLVTSAVISGKKRRKGAIYVNQHELPVAGRGEPERARQRAAPTTRLPSACYIYAVNGPCA